MAPPIRPAAALGTAVAILAGLTTGSDLAAQTAVPNLSGNYIRGDFVGLGQSDQVIDPELLTEEGQRRWLSYDYTTDDPAYGCIPSSWTRVWLNPNVVVRVSQADDHVRLRYEFMDLDRVIPLVADTDVEDAGGIEGIAHAWALCRLVRRRYPGDRLERL